MLQEIDEKYLTSIFGSKNIDEGRYCGQAARYGGDIRWEIVKVIFCPETFSFNKMYLNLSSKIQN